MEQITFGEWALVLGVAFFVGTCISAFLGWYIFERNNDD